MGESLPCCLCGASNDAGRETAVVRSNVRRFRRERFALWRCGACGSIHARDEVDLAAYYRQYPIRRQTLSWPLRRMYSTLLGRLRRAGLRRSDRILDFGCGSGLLVEFLRSRGYAKTDGYDPYCPAFAQPPEGRYDCVFAQDVAEHVADPIGTLRTFHDLTAPGGLVVIGTPDAEGVDLRRPEDFVHSLHQPYHRHIWSRRALLAATKALGWRLERTYSTAYTNTRYPFLNTRFLLRYMRGSDDTLDVLFEPRTTSALHLLKPGVLLDGLFGSFRSRGTEMLAIFRTATAGARDEGRTHQVRTPRSP